MNGLIPTINFIVWIALGIVTVWRLVPLVRGTGRSPGRIVVFVLFLTAFLSNTFAQPPVLSALNAISPGLARVLVNLALIAMFFTFIYFFSAQLPRRELFIRTWFQGLLGFLGGVAMITCWLFSANIPNYRDLPDSGPASVFLFYILGSVYLGYACAMVAWLGFRTAALPDVTQPWAFRTCAIGTTMALVGGPVVRTTSIVLRWSTGAAVTVPDWIEVVGGTLNNVGVLGFVVGLCTIGARTVIAKIRVNLRLLRDYRRLRPLWDALHDAFPAIGFQPVGGLLGRIDIRPQNIGYRYRRCIIECRDGLWRLSPYVADPGELEPDRLSIHRQAELVHDALVSIERPAQDDPIAEPVAIAAPAGDDSDDTQLILLADAFHQVALARKNDPSDVEVDSRT